ncbi:MAG: FprA family A-type flavoprotein [Lachnospiraceae bacterium]|nr:FprA family A-type flavoprotein [Lachnospiraceae bacterium]
MDISEDILYIGAQDEDLDLFESQYPVPNGMTYNSYVILDEKVAVTDTADARKLDEWMENLEEALSGRTPDYLIIHHMEPDHSAGILMMAEKYPELKIVGNAKTFPMITAFLGEDLAGRGIVVKEGEELSLGRHTLTFVMAPMIHWPEVMFSYEKTEQVLFSADAFGSFGTIEKQEEDWYCEGRRYYFNIVGKYGAQVQAALKKLSALPVRAIAPLHGPVHFEPAPVIERYGVWSRYEPEDRGVTICCAGVHGNTLEAARMLGEMLTAEGIKVKLFDLTRDDMSEAMEDCFRYDRLVLAATTYDGDLFPVMHDLIYHLKMKNYQNRTVGIIENGSWAPQSGKKMREGLEGLKNITVLEPVVTLKSAVSAQSQAQLEALAAALAQA